MKLLFTYNGEESVFHATNEDLILLRQKLARHKANLIQSGRERDLPVYSIANLDAPIKLLTERGITRRRDDPVTSTIRDILERKL